MRSLKNEVLGYILWILFSNVLIYASFYYNWKEELIQRDYLIWTIMLVIVTLIVLWLNINKIKFLNGELKFSSLILTILTSLLVSFFYFGKSFLYEETGYWMVVNNIHYFLFISIFVFIYIVFSMEIFHITKDIIIRKTKGIKRYNYHYILLFIIQILILGIYFYGLNPGNMSYDTYNQVNQLKGIISYNTWHPIGHTLFMGLLLKIWNNYAIITIFQILFFAAITSSFYRFLLKYKVKWQLVYFTAIIMVAIPSVGINLVTQWKDIPFTIGLLWGTLILFKMNIEENYFQKPIKAVEFALCLLSISLFRFNGILAFITMIVYAFGYVLRKKYMKRNLYISIAFVLTIFFVINVVVPKYLNAVPNPPGMKLRPIYQGYAGIYIAGKEESLKEESQNLIETVSSPEQIHDFYNPYFADTISTNTPNFLNNLSKIKTPAALKIYLEAFIIHPEIILGDKFNLSVSMWSVTADRFSYNNAYTTAIQKEMIEEFGVERNENKLTEIINKFAIFTFTENYLLNTLVWRTGFYLSLEFVLLLYLILKKDRRISLFIPLLCNGVIVFLTMPAQDYRYLWFIFLLFPFLALACSVDLKNKNQPN